MNTFEQLNSEQTSDSQADKREFESVKNKETISEDVLISHLDSVIGMLNNAESYKAKNSSDKNNLALRIAEATIAQPERAQELINYFLKVVEELNIEKGIKFKNSDDMNDIA